MNCLERIWTKFYDPGIGACKKLHRPLNIEAIVSTRISSDLGDAILWPPMHRVAVTPVTVLALYWPRKSSSVAS